jgi:hypothetical protein
MFSIICGRWQKIKSKAKRYIMKIEVQYSGGKRKRKRQNGEGRGG